MDCWYEKVLEMPIALNPETLENFRETVNPKDVTYKNRLKKWLIESHLSKIMLFFACCKGQIVIHTSDGAEIEDIDENVKKDV